MTDTSTALSPALTDEEWADELSDPEDWSHEEGETRLHRGEVRCGYDSGAGSQVIDNRHATAARCLHGQPFGFTREDVSVLHAMYDHVDDEIRDMPIAEFWTKFAKIVDRIEALLPPEGT